MGLIRAWLYDGKREKISGLRCAAAVILIAELLYLLYSCWLFTVPMRAFTYAGDDLVSEYGAFLTDFLGEYGDGYYLDNSLHADEEDLSLLSDDEEEWLLLTIATPKTDLSRGSWEICIHYNSSYIATYTASSDYNTYYVQAQAQSVGFAADETGGTCTFMLYTPIAVEGYQVTAQYRGTGYLFISSITMTETAVWKQVNLAIALFLFLLTAFLVLTQGNPKTRWTPSRRMSLFVMLMTILFVSAPIFTFYLYDGPDLQFHLNRIEAIRTALLDGQFPVRLSSWWLNGYGYASSVFYGDIFLYIPAILRIIGFTVQDSYKIYVFLVNTATCVISYYSFHKISGSRYAALTGSVLYTLSIFRVYDLYMRGAAGEYTALIFLPLVALGLWKIYAEPTDTEDYRHGWIPAVLGYTGIIMSHIITTFLAGLFTILLCLILLKRTLQRPRCRQLFKVLVYTVLLNLWFLVPFLDYYRFEYEMSTRSTPGRFHANAVTLSQLMNFFSDDTGSYHAVDQFSQGEAAYTVGAALLAAGVIYLGMRLYGKIEDNLLRRTGDAALGIGVLALLMSTDLFPWDYIQQLNSVFASITQNIQMPWRMFSIASTALALAAVVLICSMRQRADMVPFGNGTGKAQDRPLIEICSAFLVLLALLTCGYTISSLRTTHSFVSYQESLDLDSTDLVQGEYLPAGTDIAIADSEEPETEGRLTDLLYEKNGGTITVSCRNETSSETYVDVSFLYYKGYHAADSATGGELAVVKADSNKVRVIVPAGYEGTFTVRFTPPLYWRLSELISLMTLIALCLTALRRRLPAPQSPEGGKGNSASFLLRGRIVPSSLKEKISSQEKAPDCRKLLCSWRFWMAVVFLLAVIYRLWGLDSIPGRYQVDEVGIAYDAWSLSHYGVDRYQISWPVYFINYGGGQSALYTYTLVLIMKLFGFSQFAIRLPGVLYSLLAAGCGAGILGLIWRDTWGVRKEVPQLVFLILYAIAPYTQMGARIALDCNLMFGMSAAFLYTFLLALDRAEKGSRYRHLHFILCGAAGGLTLYTYAISYLVMPVFLVLALLCLLICGKIHVKRDAGAECPAACRHLTLSEIAAFVIPLLLLALPLMLEQYINMTGGDEIVLLGTFTVTSLESYRISEISFSNIGAHLLQTIKSALLWDGISYNSTPRYWTLYPMSVPFFFLGLAVTVRRVVRALRHRHFDRFTVPLTWLAAQIIACSLISGPNTNKVNGIFLPVLLCTVTGFVYCCHIIRMVKWKKIFIAAVTCLYALYFVSFTGYYFHSSLTLRHVFYAEALAFIESDPVLSEKALLTDTTYTDYLCSALKSPYEVDAREQDFGNVYPELQDDQVELAAREYYGYGANYIIYESSVELADAFRDLGFMELDYDGCILFYYQ